VKVVKEEKNIVTNVGNTFQKIANFALNVENSSIKSAQIVKNRSLYMIIFAFIAGKNRSSFQNVRKYRLQTLKYQ